MIAGTQVVGSGLPPRPTQVANMEKVAGSLPAGVQGAMENCDKNGKIEKMVADYRASGAGETECAALRRALQNTAAGVLAGSMPQRSGEAANKV